MVARSDGRVGGGEADRRARDDGDDLPRLRAGPLRRLAPLGGRGRDRRGRGTAARVRAVPARGAARLSVLDDRALGDHRRDRPADAAPARPRRSALPRRPVRPRRARGAAGRLRRGALRAPLANRSLHALALGVERRRLGRRGDARRRRRDRLQRRRGAQVRRVVRRDRLREAPPRRPRPLVAGGDDDRPGRAPGRGDGRRLRLPPRSRHRGGPRVRDRRRLGVRRLRHLRGGQGRVPLDRVLAADRRAERDLPRPDRVRRDGGRAGAPDRDRPGARGRLPRRAAPHPQGRVQARPVPVLRGPEPGDRRAGEPQLHLGRGRRRARARDRRAGLRRAARGALVRPLADDRARGRRRRRLRGDDVGADDRDLRVARPQHLLRADAPDLAQARRLGRPGHGRRADALPRPAARQGHEPDLAARVLELRDRQDLEPRRHGAAAVALAQPRQARRHDEPRPRRELGRDRQRRRGRRREGRRAARRDAALARRSRPPASGTRRPASIRTAG